MSHAGVVLRYTHIYSVYLSIYYTYIYIYIYIYSNVGGCARERVSPPPVAIKLFCLTLYHVVLYISVMHIHSPDSFNSAFDISNLRGLSKKKKTPGLQPGSAQNPVTRTVAEKPLQIEARTSMTTTILNWSNPWYVTHPYLIVKHHGYWCRNVLF